MLQVEKTITAGIPTLVLTGDGSFEKARQIWFYIIQLQEELDTNKLLIIDQINGQLSPVEVLEIEKYVRGLTAPSQNKIAVVNQKTGCTYKDIEFGETVAINRGWYNFKVFSEEADAISWLND